jgi:hypothetical protein
MEFINNLSLLLERISSSRFWDMGVSIGTLLAAFFAFRAVRQTSKQLEIEQTPYIVMSDRISTAAEGRMHTISLKNIGRGSAINVTVTSDPEGKISIIEGTNPHSINLSSAEPHNGWAIDESRVIEGLKIQGIEIKKSISQELPDENNAKNENEIKKSDFFIYIWYKNQYGHRYKTEAKMRHSGPFFKVMENNFKKLS